MTNYKLCNLSLIKKYPGFGIICNTDEIKYYQNNFRYYEDEYQPSEPEIETDNFFYERFLKRK